ncbi:aspartate aminotransferase, cytoplasmic-like [Rana temporaria]|uniref:aspartate aminotransferase, cytoplasmic-like n=1 Tax=Rana temporaria TaxID=8407 RepID=UPI001AACA633|nr:aspartate aminotransferase, cytoplasmic-like [Rana temporaria]XP_040202053.1 aspartate aminotransferase, cytoplasmic-like [Rana temporaria]
MTSLSVFIDVPKASKLRDEQQEEDFLKDRDRRKIFLGQKVFLSDDGLPWVPLPVKKVYLQILNDPTRNYEDLPVGGNQEFLRGVMELALGKNNKAILENRAGGIQTPGSTGAFRLGIEFLSQWYSMNPKMSVCIPHPDCDGYKETLEAAGITTIYTYRVWDSKQGNLAISDMLDDLETFPDYSIIVLPISCTPTGIQFNKSEWKQITTLLKKKNIFPFFNLKGQGLSSGDVDADAWPLRHFVSEDFDLFCAQSFSATFGLYGESVGCLLVVMRNNRALIGVRSQLECLVLRKWSSPPATGARVVATVLNNPTLHEEWKENLKMATKRLMVIREKMREKLRLLETLRSWNQITQQSGLFTYFGLTKDKIDFLAKRNHIYLPENGQINISGLNMNNIHYVTQCISDVTLNDTR